MKLQFKHRTYQADAVKAVVDCFQGQPKSTGLKYARKPLRAVFRDDGFGDDNTRINVEQIFKLLSPGTEVKSL